MLTEPSKLFLRLTGLCLPLVVVYGALGNDRTGVVLFLALLGASATAGLFVLSARRVEVPLPVTDPLSSVVGDAEGPGALGPSGAPLMAAASLSLLLAGLVLGPGWALAGAGFGGVSLVWWAAEGVGEHRARPVNLLPVAVPVLVLAVIGSIVFFMSRILLAVPEKPAVMVAMAVAILILFGGATVAARPQLRTSQLAAVLAIVAVLLVVGGLVAAAVGERHEEVPAQVREAEAGLVQMSANHIAFARKTLQFHADKPVDLHFVNDDKTIPHNIAVYTNENAQQVVFRGEIVVGPGSADYRFTAPPAGSYYFRCDVHPAMNGTVTSS